MPDTQVGGARQRGWRTLTLLQPLESDACAMPQADPQVLLDLIDGQLQQLGDVCQRQPVAAVKDQRSAARSRQLIETSPQLRGERLLDGLRIHPRRSSEYAGAHAGVTHRTALMLALRTEQIEQIGDGRENVPFRVTFQILAIAAAQQLVDILRLLVCCGVRHGPTRKQIPDLLAKTLDYAVNECFHALA